MSPLALYRQKLDDARGVIAVSILTTLLVAWLQVPSPHMAQKLLNRLDLLLYDVRFNTMLPYRIATKADHQIAIIDIDERSLKTIGHWPWNRKIVANLVDRLGTAGVSVIAFDVVFAEPEENRAAAMVRELDSEILAHGIAAIADRFDYDQLLANAFKQRDVVLGFILHEESYASAELPPANIHAATDGAHQMPIADMHGYTANIPILQQAATGAGFINGPPDDDGIVRRAPLTLRHNNQLYTSLALQTVMTYLILNDVQLQTAWDGASQDNILGLQLGDRFIHTDEKGRVLIPYRGPKRTFQYYSAADVLDGTIGTNELAGRIVMIGTSAIGLVDLRTTPVGTGYPGIESQATIVDALLRGDVPYKPDIAIGASVVGIILLGLLLCLLLPVAGPMRMTIIGLSGILTIVGSNFAIWQHYNLDLPLAGSLTTVILIYGINISVGFFNAAQQKDQIKSMFGQYVAPEHINRLLEDPASLSFEGESKELTVLFADIRGFTSISEALTANELKNLLNRFFTPMTEVIFAHQGTIDKYVGDMIMAFWGAPLDDPEQKENAVATALLMQQKVRELHTEFQKLGYPPVNIGIGINTGMMNVGDMGSAYRRAYTVLGDAVNLGSRLESITKFYHSPCLVSETTKQGIEDRFIFREVDYIQVKGKKEPIRVYEPLAHRENATEELLGNVALYDQARHAYLIRDWEEAKELFIELAMRDAAAEPLCEIYLERIEMYRDETLPDDWCGVWQHSNK